MSQLTQFLEFWSGLILFFLTVGSFIVSMGLAGRKGNYRWLLIPAFLATFDLGVVIGYFSVK